jgi:hypothetical protein
MSVEGWPNGTSGRISKGQWEGCWADVYSDDAGGGWHIEISGVPVHGGSVLVNWARHGRCTRLHPRVGIGSRASDR